MDSALVQKRVKSVSRNKIPTHVKHRWWNIMVGKIPFQHSITFMACIGN